METKSFKTVVGKFRRKFNFNNYPQKSQIYRWVHKFQATGSVDNLTKKVENPRSGKKLIPRCPDNMDAVRKVHPKTIPRNWSFMFIHTKNLKEGFSAVSIQNPDQS